MDLLQYPFYTHPFLLFKTIFLIVLLFFIILSPTPRSKKLKVEIKKDENISSDIEM